MKLILVSAKIELSKICLLKKYKTLLVIQSVISIIAILITSRNGPDLTGFNLDIPSMPYAILSALYTICLPLIIIMLVSDLFSYEIENGTIKSIFLRPIERYKIYISKILGIICYIFMNLIVLCVIMFVMRIVFGGAYDKIFDIIISYFVTVVPMITLTAMFALISQIIGNTTLSAFTSIIIYILLKSIGFVSIKVSSIVFTSHFGWYRMFLSSNINYSQIVNIFIMNLSYTVLFSILGYYLFNRKEL